jgi:hypothetical protein
MWRERRTIGRICHVGPVSVRLAVPQRLASSQTRLNHLQLTLFRFPSRLKWGLEPPRDSACRSSSLQERHNLHLRLGRFSIGRPAGPSRRSFAPCGAADTDAVCGAPIVMLRTRTQGCASASTKSKGISFAKKSWRLGQGPQLRRFGVGGDQPEVAHFGHVQGSPALCMQPPVQTM